MVNDIQKMFRTTFQVGSRKLSLYIIYKVVKNATQNLTVVEYSIVSDDRLGGTLFTETFNDHFSRSRFIRSNLVKMIRFGN